MNDDPTVIRQWRMLRMLGVRRHGIVVSDMAREFGVTDRTIRRDLQKLQELGFPINEITGERGCKIWRLADHAVVPPLAFTYDEAIVLHLARPFLEPLCGTQLWESAHSALRKIRATLTEHAREYVEHFPRVFHCTTHGFSNYADKAEIIDTLTIAAEDRNAVLLTYQSRHATEPATRDVYPYGMTRHKGSLYLVAFAVAREEIRLYKVNRIEAAEITSLVFDRPNTFDIAEFLADAFGVFGGSESHTVVVKILPPAARYVLESHWHASQLITPQRDGSVLAQFQLSSTVEVKSWVLSFGACAVVLEPKELREEMVAELVQMTRLYESATFSSPTESLPDGHFRRSNDGRSPEHVQRTREVL